MSKEVQTLLEIGALELTNLVIHFRIHVLIHVITKLSNSQNNKKTIPFRTTESSEKLLFRPLVFCFEYWQKIGAMLARSEKFL